MSSLLSNDFVEEFFRIENTLTTNFQTFYTDRENRLIFTTPFFITRTITSDFVIELDNNHTSDNVNIIMDSITLLSTNPNIQNYMPLKISLGASESSKPKYEFDNNYIPLTSYKIIVDPPINLNTVSNDRFSSPVNSVIEVKPTTSPDFRILNVVQCGDLIWYHTYDGVNHQLWLYRLDEGTYIEIPINVSFALIEIYATSENDNQAVMLVEELADNEYSFFDLIPTGNDPTNPVGPTDYKPKLIVGNLIGVQIDSVTLFNNKLIFWTNDGLNERLNIYTRDLPLARTSSTLSTYHQSYSDIGWFTFITHDAVGFYGTNKYAALSAFGKEFAYVQKGVNDEILYQIGVTYFQTIIGTPIRIYFGGSNIDRPIVNVFTLDNVRNLFWYRFPFEYWIDLLNGLRPIEIEPVLLEEDVVNFFSMKQYVNTAYFCSQKLDTVFCNLDTGVVSRYHDDDIQVGRGLSTANFTVYGYINSTEAVTVGDRILTAYYKNKRYVLDDLSVYKMQYNYAERINPYHLTDNFVFTVSLPNNTPVADLEIFKYIFDFRIRYAKERMVVNKAIKSSDNGEGDTTTKTKFTKRSKTIGDVDQILGYVPEDFNVSDFLNIYTTR